MVTSITVSCPKSWRERGKSRWTLGGDGRRHYVDIIKTLPDLSKLTKQSVFLADPQQRDLSHQLFKAPGWWKVLFNMCFHNLSGTGEGDSLVNASWLLANGVTCHFSFFIDHIKSMATTIFFRDRTLQCFICLKDQYIWKIWQ